MATRRYKISPGMTEFEVIEEAGAAVNSHVVELTIDLGNDVTDSGGLRQIKKQEILQMLEYIENHIVSYPSPTGQ